jgi:hypothetical protein
MSLIKKMLANAAQTRVGFTLFGEEVFMHRGKPDLAATTRAKAGEMAERESVVNPDLKAVPYIPTERDRAAWMSSPEGALFWQSCEEQGVWPSIYEMELQALRVSIFSTLYLIQMIHKPNGDPLVEGITARERNENLEQLCRMIREDESARSAIHAAAVELEKRVSSLGAKEASDAMGKAAKKKASPPRKRAKGR